MKRFTSLLLLSIFVFSACTEKRKQIFAQGQGTNLESIQSWNDQLVDIDTGNVIGIPSTTHAQDGVKISDRVKSMNHFDLVQMQIQDPKFKTLIGTPPFRGKPNTHGVYQAQIKLTEKYLKISKVAKKEDLPFDEYFYIEETLSDGRVTIPLLGYKVKAFYRIEPQKNEDDQNSHHLIEVEEDDPAKATHVRIDWSSREVFEPIKKIDLFPASIFFAQTKDGQEPYEWYYSETVTEKSMSDSSTIIGENKIRSDRSNLSPASKVIFVPRESELRVVDVARDERMSRNQIRHSADLNSQATLILPVAWKDYQIKAEGSNPSMKGEVVEDRQWNQRQYFEADFPSLRSSAVADGKTRLLDIEIDQNYMSFTVMNMIGNEGRKIHYSFLRADQGRLPYQAKISTEKDRNTFGFFTTSKPYVDNWEYYTKNDYRNRVYMNRMNPDQKQIVFHLSIESPRELEDVAQMAVQAWDKTFEEALGKNKLKIIFSPERVTLGDLRYNTIHLVDTLSEDGLLGFGPSVADPETGEIISASTNIYVNSIQSIAVSSIRQYIINRLEGRLTKGSWMDPSLDPQLTLTAKKALANLAFLQNDRKHIDQWMQNLSITREELQAVQREASTQRCTYAQQAASSSNDRDIEKFCPAVEKIVAAYQSSSFSKQNSEQNWEKLWAESKEAIRTCSKQITRGKLLSTLIHEIGHNFGLRHNFYGSYDKANFKKSKTIFGETILAHSSSIMEYTDWDEDRLTETGAYDLAAIRFGYGNQVELKNGTLLDVGTESIEKALTAKQKQTSDLKPYLFCNDEAGYTGMNALCRPHDAGTSPLEIVRFYIAQYERNENLRRFRRATPNIYRESKVGENNLVQVFLPLREIYDQWRTHLGEYVKKSNRYLTNFNPTTYTQMLENMKNDPQYGSFYEQYFEASREIYTFLKSVVFQPNQYCVIDDLGSTRAIEFLTLRDQLLEATRGTVQIRNCAEAQSASELAKVLGMNTPKILSEIGYPIQSYRYSKYENMDDLSDDVLGNGISRKNAAYAIAGRFSTAQNELNSFSPSMLDEPTLMSDFSEALLSRIVDGVNLKDVGFKDYQPLFNAEAELIKRFAFSVSLGLSVPGDRLETTNKIASNNRFRFFRVYSPTQYEDLSKKAAVLRLDGRAVYAADSKDANVMAYRLIRRYNQVDYELGLSTLSDSDRQKIVAFLGQILPPAAQATSMTLKDFEKISAALDSIPAKMRSLLTCMGSGLTGINQLLRAHSLFQNLVEQTSSQGEEALNKLYQATVQQLIEALEDKTILFTAEELTAQLNPASIACSKKQNETILFNQRYGKDLEAQKGLILNILGMYSD